MSDLPEYCVPASELLATISRLFGTCIPTTQSLVSTTFGILSIASWLCAQMPQVLKNYQRQSVDGLSWVFLGIWLGADVCNLLGAIWTNQMWFQCALATYYVLVDLVLVSQYIYFSRVQKLSNEDAIDGISVETRSFESSSSGGEDGMKRYASNGKGRKARSLGHTLIVLVGLTFTLAGALPAEESSGRLVSPFLPGGIIPIRATMSPAPEENMLAKIGGVLSWISTLLYLISRFPQILLNARRRSTDGIAIHLFIAAFFGNLFYSCSLLANPLGWYDYPSNGGGGIAGPEGSNAVEWWGRTLPFFLGAAGVLAMDAAVGLQWWIWGDGTEGKFEEGKTRKWWRRREGKERRRKSEGEGEEGRGLLREGESEGGYGGLGI